MEPVTACSAARARHLDDSRAIELLAWPDAEKQRYADEHRDGWAEYLDRLTTLLAKRQSECQ